MRANRSHALARGSKHVMTEEKIRSDIRTEISNRFSRHSGARIIEEMEVCSGRARVDMAVISDLLIGIEIKGPNDDLHRLPGQANQYSECFDQVVLVVHDGLANAAAELVPGWWGIVVGADCGEAYTYRLRRRPRKNPGVKAEAVLSLLWKVEIGYLWAEFFLNSPPAKASKKRLRHQLLSTVSAERLRAAGISLLKNRMDWRALPIT